MIGTQPILLISAIALAQISGDAADQAEDSRAVLERFLTAEFSFQRTPFGERLIELGDRSVIPILVQDLDNPDRQKRCEAAVVLDALGDPRGHPALLREMYDTDADNRLVGQFDDGGNPYLIGQIRSDRYYAAALLRRLGPKVVPDLIAATEDPLLNLPAAYGLGVLGDTSAVPALRRMLAQADDFYEELNSATALARLGEEDGFQTLIELAREGPEWQERWRATTALGDVGDPRAFNTLLLVLRDDDVHVRVEAIRSLAKLENPDAIPHLEGLLNDTERTTKQGDTTAATEAELAITALMTRQ